MFQKLKDKWLKKQEDKLWEEFNPRIEELRLSMDLQTSELKNRLDKIGLDQRELDALEKRVQDRREDLLKVNDELKDQIRMIEAKASPDQVWTSAFQAGFSKCWDIMWEFQSDQVVKLRDKIKSQAINETLERLNGHSL